MKTRTRIIVALIIGAFGGVWVVNEHREAPLGINPPSHIRQVGLGFRHERNDLPTFKMTGPVVMPVPATGGL